MNISNSQITTVNLNEKTLFSASFGTYIKDINHTFDPYLGIWKYQNGNEIFIIKLEKVTKYYDADFKVYFDFIKGNYSYSTDGGITFLVNSILTNSNNNSPDDNPIYSSDPAYFDNNNFSFKDILFNKSCFATVKFISGSTSQLEFQLSEWTRGYIIGEQPIPSGFSIPNNVILTKQ